MEVTMLLCDAAEEVGGKLYILGGGWSNILTPGVPISAALAVKVSVPWVETNRRHRIRAVLQTDDGAPVDLGEGPIMAEGQFAVGRPVGISPGSSIDAAFVLKFEGLALGAGGYVWQLYINDNLEAKAPIRVLAGR